MLPTMDRPPRRSRYSSATRGLRRPPDSSRATRVSPRSTLTSTCFFTKGSLDLEAGPKALVRACGAPLRVDRLQEAEGQKGGEHRRAAITHERQRDARDRHDPQRHPDVDEDLEQQHA